MNKYTEANKRLAIALGWTEIKEVAGALLGTPPDGAPRSRGQVMVPDWCGDWRECGPLLAMDVNVAMVAIKRETSSATLGDEYHCGRASECHDLHESKDAATRFSIVRAACLGLEAAK